MKPFLLFLQGYFFLAYFFLWPPYKAHICIKWTIIQLGNLNFAVLWFDFRTNIWACSCIECENRRPRSFWEGFFTAQAILHWHLVLYSLFSLPFGLIFTVLEAWMSFDGILVAITLYLYCYYYFGNQCWGQNQYSTFP